MDEFRSMNLKIACLIMEKLKKVYYFVHISFTELLTVLFIHSFIYSHSIDHTDVEFVIKYKYK